MSDEKNGKTEGTISFSSFCPVCYLPVGDCRKKREKDITFRLMHKKLEYRVEKEKQWREGILAFVTGAVVISLGPLLLLAVLHLLEASL